MTPWARNALAAAGLTEGELRDLTPPGWHLHGFGRTARGPWTFELVSTDSNVVPLRKVAIAHRIADVREAIAGLLASVTPDLELQLSASLAVLEKR
jgi:hypothetical protein